VQHIDPGERGRQTGFIPARIAKEVGAVGALLNHSEHKLSVGVLGETMAKCKEVGLKTLVFADGLEEAMMITKFQPDYIGYEPPELVASKETSVSKSKPEVIEKVVKEVPSAPIIVGAGVKEMRDVEVALRLGAKGIAIASAVVLASDQKKIINELASAFR
jgi:triosephosphate isomerase